MGRSAGVGFAAQDFEQNDRTAVADEPFRPGQNLVLEALHVDLEQGDVLALLATRCRLKDDPDVSAFDHDPEPRFLQHRTLEPVWSFLMNFTL